MIDSKEKMKHCLKIEKENYYPGGGGKSAFRLK